MPRAATGATHESNRTGTLLQCASVAVLAFFNAAKKLTMLVPGAPIEFREPNTTHIPRPILQPCVTLLIPLLAFVATRTLAIARLVARHGSIKR
jgi:hypothetical protein